MTPDLEIFDIRTIAARLERYDWAFSRTQRAAIDAHWQAQIAAKPRMFNGRVLLQHAGRRDGDVFTARYFETDYADFLAWHHFGFPPPMVRNGFAMAALRARDGAFLLGEMGAHTANAGKIYFAAGTPDLHDVRADGTVDLAGSVLRELQEETGLTAQEFSVGSGWTVVLAPGRVAFMRPVTIDLPADEARAMMRARIATQADQELSDIVIIRDAAASAQDRIPVFMQAYLRHAFGQGQPG